MSLKKKLLIALSVVAAVALVAGLTTIAATNYGTKNDPLVTLSYLNDVVKTEIKASVESAVKASENSLSSRLDAKINEFESDISGMVSSSSSSANTFTVVTLSSGDTLVCSVGTEIMLRIGSAEAAGPSAPRLIDETDGSSLSEAGKALVKNHMYMVTIQKNGITATANNTKVLIRGTYTIE